MLDLKNIRFRHNFATRLGLVFIVLCALTGLLAHVTFWLSGAGQVDMASIEAIPAPERQATEPKALHSISEWPADKPRTFGQAPALAARVEAGELPPVAERLPENPLVIHPAHQLGPYGGTWARHGTSPSDIGIFEHRLAYDGLVRWDPMGREILPNLATHWDIEDEGRTYTFYLRRGVKWSDGHPFTADDIAFWYQDVLHNADLTPVIPTEYRKGGNTVQFEKVDDYTIRFRYAEPYGLFLKMMASNLSYQLVRYPAHYLKQFHPHYTPVAELEKQARTMGKDFWYQLFQDRLDYRNIECPRLWAWVVSKPPPARPSEFVRNPYYWKVDNEGQQLPYIDRITFEIYDLETINIKAINGELGMQGRHLTFQNYPIFMANQKRGGYKIRHWLDGGDSNTAIVFNLNHKDLVLRQIFHQRDFRIAMSHAINRDAIREAAFLGIGESRQISPPPISAYHVPEHAYAYLEFDPALANKLLDGIGLKKRDDRGIRLRPDGEPLLIHIETSSTMLGAGKMFEMIAANWRAVGVEAKVKTQARQLYAQRRNALLCDVLVWGGAGETIPTLDPRWFLPYSNSSFHALDYARWYRSGGKLGTEPTTDMLRVIELFGQLERTVEEEAQIRLFKEILEINRQNLWVIGTVGAIPPLFIVKDTFRNVPEVAVGCWPLRTPGATAPESYAIDEG
jgi:peptide/nickel transport system substrate-binding protein